jgi:phosphoribosylglycinamide formyltransferase-1
MKDEKIHIAIFASGLGTNAVKLIEHFKNHAQIEVCLIVCNNPKAGVIEKANDHKVECLLIEKDPFLNGDGYVAFLKKRQINWIILAGFLWKIPKTLIEAFPNRIVNIHPALLPKFGGKGMYGMHVHEAVLKAKEEKSGITIHLVDEIYDHGKIIFQAECNVDASETPETLAKKVQELEHTHFAREVEKFVSGPSFPVFRKTNNE